jgi:hyperosmotically inducible protein
MLKSSTVVPISGLLFALTFAALADDTARSRSDAGINARVKTALIANDETKARQINVETENGIVQLSGFVDSGRAKTAATTTAQSVSGVKQVHNELVVGDEDRAARRAADDTVTAAKVKSELATDAGFATANDVNVEVREGVVQLSGFVASIDQKQRAEQIAREVAEVTDVRNSIEVELPR